MVHLMKNITWSAGFTSVRVEVKVGASACGDMFLIEHSRNTLESPQVKRVDEGWGGGDGRESSMSAAREARRTTENPKGRELDRAHTLPKTFVDGPS